MGEAQSKALRNLLLHKLPSAQVDELEDRILEDGEFADQIEVAAADLLDDYARRLLSPEDAKLVEEHLLTAPDALQRLSFAKALAEARLSRNNPQLHPAERSFSMRRVAVFAAACAACLFLGALAIIQFRHHETPSSTSVKPAPGTGISTPGKPSSSADSGDENDTRTAFTIVLLASQARGNAERRFVVPARARQLRIQCEVPLDDGSPEFHMVLRDAAGHFIDSSEHLQPTQSADIHYVQASYPAGQLEPGRYTVSIAPARHSARAIASYEFLLQFSR
jgi:hypothetical protein